MNKQEFLEASPWYESEPKRIKQLAFDDGYRIGKQEVIDEVCKMYCCTCHPATVSMCEERKHQDAGNWQCIAYQQYRKRLERKFLSELDPMNNQQAKRILNGADK